MGFKKRLLVVLFGIIVCVSYWDYALATDDPFISYINSANCNRLLLKQNIDRQPILARVAPRLTYFLLNGFAGERFTVAIRFTDKNFEQLQAIESKFNVLGLKTNVLKHLGVVIIDGEKNAVLQALEEPGYQRAQLSGVKYLFENLPTEITSKFEGNLYATLKTMNEKSAVTPINPMGICPKAKFKLSISGSLDQLELAQLRIQWVRDLNDMEVLETVYLPKEKRGEIVIKSTAQALIDALVAVPEITFVTTADRHNS